MLLRKILTGLLAFSVAASALATVANAVEPSYRVSDAYEDTGYYNNLLTLELTGDGVTDTIAVALSQLGYHEGNNDAQKDGMNSSGSKNFVEYNVLFGKLDNGEGNGTSYGYAWCAAFVNWCLRQARVDLELTGGMYVSCASWRNWFIYEGWAQGASYHARTADYTPKKGDLIFFKSLSATHSRPTDHIGIVLKVEDGKVYTIEGNGDNRVALHEYALTDRYIVGYGSIAYPTADVPVTDYYAKEEFAPGYYISGTGIIAAYQGPDTASGKVTKLSVSTVYFIDCVDGRYGRVTLEDGTQAWVSLKRFTPMTAEHACKITLVADGVSKSVTVQKGCGWQLPDAAALGVDMQDFACWSESTDGTGTAYAPGEMLTPEQDTVLYASATLPTDSEDIEANTTVQEQQESESVLESDTVPEQKSQGCGSILGVSALWILTAGAVLVARKKK